MTSVVNGINGLVRKRPSLTTGKANGCLRRLLMRSLRQALFTRSVAMPRSSCAAPSQARRWVAAATHCHGLKPPVVQRKGNLFPETGGPRGPSGTKLKVGSRLPPLAVGSGGLAAHAPAFDPAAAAGEPGLGQALGQAPAIEAALAHRAHHRAERAGQLALTLLANQGRAIGLKQPHQDQLVEAVFLSARGDEAHREQALELLLQLHLLAMAWG